MSPVSVLKVNEILPRLTTNMLSFSIFIGLELYSVANK
jgi:hypothetical protein